MKNILVTGAAGFVAEHLIPALREEGNRVIGLDRKPAPSADCDSYICCDLLDSEMINAVKGRQIDVVIHMAAARADWGVSDAEFLRDNVDATAALLRLCSGLALEKLLFVSSISVMPQSSPELLDETAPYEPINIYGESKMEAESLCMGFAREHPSTQTLMIRPAVLYGPSDPTRTGMYRAVDNNIFRLIDGIYSRRFAILGDGETVKTTAYVKNFCDALRWCLMYSGSQTLFVYADEPPEKMKNLVFVIRKALGRGGQGPRLPYGVLRHVAIVLDYISALTGVNLPITRARIDTFVRPTNFHSRYLRELGFEQAISTKAAVNETVNWYLRLRRKSKKNFLFLKE